MKSGIVVGCLLLAFVTAADAADCVKDQDGKVVCGAGQCATNQYGKVFCAKEGGGAVRDRFGGVKCGVGMCAEDNFGTVKCSNQPGGGALRESSGKVKCLGACQNGSAQRCATQRETRHARIVRVRAHPRPGRAVRDLPGAGTPFSFPRGRPGGLGLALAGGVIEATLRVPFSLSRAELPLMPISMFQVSVPRFIHTLKKPAQHSRQGDGVRRGEEARPLRAA